MIIVSGFCSLVMQKGYGGYSDMPTETHSDMSMLHIL